MMQLVRTHPIRALLASLLLLSVLAATLAFSSGSPRHGCTSAQGLLLQGAEGEGPGRMIGTIAGDYVYEAYSGDYHPDGAPEGVIFNWGLSHVEGRRGTIRFREFTAIDNDEQQRTNGAALFYIDGGTGQWENATGHISLSGYWHMLPVWDGRWTYQGEICIP